MHVRCKDESLNKMNKKIYNFMKVSRALKNLTRFVYSSERKQTYSVNFSAQGFSHPIHGKVEGILGATVKTSKKPK